MFFLSSKASDGTQNFTTRFRSPANCGPSSSVSKASSTDMMTRTRPCKENAIRRISRRSWASSPSRTRRTGSEASNVSERSVFSRFDQLACCVFLPAGSAESLSRQVSGSEVFLLPVYLLTHMYARLPDERMANQMSELARKN